MTHGFALTPDAIDLSPRSSLAASGVTSLWADTVGATTFTAHTNVNVAGAALLFDWIAFSPKNGPNSAGILITDSFPFAYAGAFAGWEAHMLYAINAH